MLAAEDIAEMRQRALPGLKDGDFAENLVLSGIDLGALGLGSRLRLGAEAELRITQLGKQCHQRCAIYDADRRLHHAPAGAVRPRACRPARSRLATARK